MPLPNFVRSARRDIGDNTNVRGRMRLERIRL